MPSHAVPAPGTGNARLEQALAVAHQAAAAGWLAAAAIAPAPEGIMYGLLAATSALRWRAVADVVISGPARIPLRVLGALLAWSVASSLIAGGFAGAVTGIPGRTSLAPFLVAAAGLGPRWLVGATVVPGVYWTVLLLLQKLAPAPWQVRMIPHPSATFVGLQWLCALGVGVASTKGPVLARASGAIATALAFVGAGLAQSRTLAIAMLISLLTTPMIPAGLRSRFSRAWLNAPIVIAAVFAIWMSPIGQKSAGHAAALLREGTHPSFDSVDRLLSHRWYLHVWTAERATTDPSTCLLGHGTYSWRRDFHAAAPSGPANPDNPGYPPAAFFGHAHELYLQTLYEQGAVGLAILISLGIAIAAVGWRLRSTSSLPLAALTCVGMTAVIGLTEGEWMSKSFMAMVAWMTSAACARTASIESRSNSPDIAS